MTQQRTDLIYLRLMLVLFCIAVSFLFFARIASAQVVINEVAWMGTDVSTNGSYCEWIELSNTGTESVDLSNWTLSFGSTSKVFNEENGAALSIAPHSFYLIERLTPSACPDPVPSISADWMVSFGSGISNNGTIIFLKNESGIEVDSVDGTDGWKVGGVVAGDSLTKETAQKGNSGWFTGASTPRVANSSQESSPASSVSQSSPAVSSSSTSDSSSYFDASVYTRISIQSGSTVSGAPILFLGEAVDSKKKPIENAIYVWAFGDGETGSGKTASHIFRYAGNYVVTLEVTSGQGSTPVITHLKVNVSPALLSASLYATSSSAINITNEGTKDVDLSSWILSADYHRFVIPEHTMLLAGSTVTFSPETTKFRSPVSFIQILYPNGSVYEQAKKEVEKPVLSSSKSLVSNETVFMRSEVVEHPEVPLQKATFQSSKQTASVIDAVTPLEPDFPTSSPSQKGDGLWIWYTVVAFLAALALFGLRFVQSKSSDQKTTFTADDFKIIETIDDNEPH